MVGMATGQPNVSTTTARHQIPNPPWGFLQTGHVMESFKDTFLGLGPICDADCTVMFDKKAVTIRDDGGRAIIL